MGGYVDRFFKWASALLLFGLYALLAGHAKAAETWNDGLGMPEYIGSVSADKAGNVWLLDAKTATLMKYRNGALATAALVDSASMNVVLPYRILVPNGDGVTVHALRTTPYPNLPSYTLRYHTHFSWNGSAPPLQSDVQGQIFHYDDSGAVWSLEGNTFYVSRAGNRRAIVEHSAFDNTIQNSFIGTPLASSAVLKCLPDRGGAVWLLVLSGSDVYYPPFLVRYSPQGDSLAFQDPFANPKQPCCVDTRFPCCEDAVLNPSGGLYLATDSGVFAWTTGKARRLGKDTAAVSRIFVDAAGKLWAADFTRDSVHIKRWDGGAWEIMKTVTLDRGDYHATAIRSITQDTQGNIWFAGLQLTYIYNASGVTGTARRPDSKAVRGVKPGAGGKPAAPGRWTWREAEYDARGARGSRAAVGR